MGDLNLKMFYQTHLDEKNNDMIKQRHIKLFGKEIFNNYIEEYNINKENTLDNINNLSRMVNEYCLMYYLFKNDIYKNYDYIGVCHYNRFFNLFIVLKVLKDLDNDIFLPLSILTNDNHFIKSFRGVDEFLDSRIKKFIPKVLFDDVYEYVHTSPDLSNLNKLCNFYNRGSFFANKKLFNDISNFVTNFFLFILRKYNISLENNIFKKWYFDNCIKEYQTNVDLRKERIFQPIEKYDEVYNPLTDFGYNSYCNCWRAFGFIYEILLSIYMCYNNKGYKVKIYNYYCNFNHII